MVLQRGFLFDDETPRTTSDLSENKNNPHSQTIKKWLNRAGFVWCAWEDSNLWPLESEANIMIKRVAA
jgi:hypothetical protein